jgi:hypothetical protein
MKSINIKTIKDVTAFFQSLYDLYDVAFHPDDCFGDYVDNLGNPTFTDEEAIVLDETMEKCFFLCDKIGVDLYEIGCEAQLKEFTKRGIFPQVA